MSATIEINIDDPAGDGPSGGGPAYPPPDLAARWSAVLDVAGIAVGRFASRLGALTLPPVAGTALTRFATQVNVAGAALGRLAARASAPGGGGGAPTPPSLTPAVFDRPQAVVIVGPRPLPVTVMGGRLGGSAGGRGGSDFTNAAAGAFAAGIRGGGIGAALGGAAGTAVGARYGGAAGGAIGGAVGERAGGFADNPLAPVASFGKNVAAGDAMGAMGNAADAAALGLMLIPGVGLLAAGALKAVAGAATSSVEVMGAFAARGRELSGYNGQIAAAGAQQDVTRILTDIRESQLLGDKYAELINTQTRVEETLKAGLLPIKEFFLERIPPFMDAMLENIIAGLRLANRFSAFNYMRDIADRMQEMLDALKGGVGEFSIETWMKPRGGLGFAAPAAPAAAGPLGVPLVGP